MILPSMTIFRLIIRHVFGIDSDDDDDIHDVDDVTAESTVEVVPNGDVVLVTMLWVSGIRSTW
jgi:hypothetical protein